MPPYEPTSRRPIAEPFRRTARAATQLCVRLGIHPDAISYLSMVAALAAGICFWKSGKLPWRMVALHVGAWATFASLEINRGSIQSIATFTILDWTCLLVIAGCLQTIVVRLKRIMAALEKKS